MNLTYFTSLNFYKSLQTFFEDLHIPLVYKTKDTIPLKALLKDEYKPNLALMLDTLNGNTPTHYLGTVNQQIFDTQKDNSDILQEVQQKDYDGLFVFGIDLGNPNKLPSKTVLTELTRAVHRRFKYVPIVVIFKYQNYISFTTTERLAYQQKWREGEKIGKVSLLKDVDTKRTHRGHQDTLAALKIDTKKTQSFKALIDQWKQVFDTKLLGKRFYQEIANWFFWATKTVEFPQIRPENDKIENKTYQQESIIRLLTRFLFCWFLKEKGFIKSETFDSVYLSKILPYFSPEAENLDVPLFKKVESPKDKASYYKAILQNLFFGTLSMPLDKREYLDAGFQGKNKNYGNQYVYRYGELFGNETSIQTLFENVPFLNGGLFECLDKVPKEENELTEEIRLDGFSSTEKNKKGQRKQAFVPDFLFFGNDTIDLSQEYDETKYKKVSVRGLINILNEYKFTVEENTPLEEEVALDPELLGQIFENLLASVDETTGKMARKATGSFYTPREIVDYMVEQSLLAYLQNSLPELQDLKDLPQFDKQKVIQAFDEIKILDPACGSGAFPMGVLNKMVELLRIIDPNNQLWFESLINSFPSVMRQDMRLKYQNENLDYLRKLGIILKSIYGIDIQPIAVQITKLRCFLSLVIEQKTNPKREENFGIKPLPNLEFKFVAANTLIDVPKLPYETKKNQENIAKFSRYTQDYFSIEKHDEKDETKKNIKQIIAEIVAFNQREIERLTKQSKTKEGKNNTQKIDEYKNGIAHWNSFKNLFEEKKVEFFNLQYFFPEVNEGFDIVIGNPPYIQIQNLNISKSLINHYLSFIVSEYKVDLYHLFIQKAIDICKKNGIISYIVPNTFIKNKFSKKLRKYIYENTKINKIILFYEQVFENASVDNLIFFLSKTKVEEYNIRFSEVRSNFIKDISEEHSLNVSLIKSPEYVFNLTSTSDNSDNIVLSKINGTNCKVISEIGRAYFGIQTFERNKYVKSEKEYDYDYPVIDGTNILPYNLLNSTEYIEYKKENIKSGGDIKFYNRKRIVVRQIGKYPQGCICSEFIFALNTVYNIVIDDIKFNLKYVLSIINSKIIQYYWTALFFDNKETFPKIKKNPLEQIPIPQIPLSAQKPFEDLVDVIIAKKAKGEATQAEEAEIDARVADLYGLTAEERKIVGI